MGPGAGIRELRQTLPVADNLIHHLRIAVRRRMQGWCTDTTMASGASVELRALIGAVARSAMLNGTSMPLSLGNVHCISDHGYTIHYLHAPDMHIVNSEQFATMSGTLVMNSDLFNLLHAQTHEDYDLAYMDRLVSPGQVAILVPHLHDALKLPGIQNTSETTAGGVNDWFTAKNQSTNSSEPAIASQQGVASHAGLPLYP